MRPPRHVCSKADNRRDSPHDSLQEAIEKLIPKSLDAIFRANRDTGRLGLASNAELRQLAISLDAGAERHTLTHWQVIMLHITAAGASIASPRLVGRVRGSGESWITSHVTGVDLNNGLVQTANSLYRIEGERVGEDELDLIHICAALNTWGIGQHFGVPEFFF